MAKEKGERELACILCTVVRLWEQQPAPSPSPTLAGRGPGPEPLAGKEASWLVGVSGYNRLSS